MYLGIGTGNQFAVRSQFVPRSQIAVRSQFVPRNQIAARSRFAACISVSWTSVLINHHNFFSKYIKQKLSPVHSTTPGHGKCPKGMLEIRIDGCV